MVETTNMPSVGQAAPLFAGLTQSGETVALSDYRGRKVALYFYPEDDTPGCTRQACNLRDGHAALLRAGVAVLGVSADDVASHGRFAQKYHLPFPLLADPDRQIIRAYGVWMEKNLYGRRYMGISRTTFLIDEAGILQHILKRPKVETHTQEILEKFGLA